MIKQRKTDFNGIRSQIKKNLEQQGFEPQYIEIRRQEDLRLPGKNDTSLVILGAVRLGNTRLIDNITFELE